MYMVKDFKKLCTPARIYFAIAVIGSIFALFKGFGIVAIFFKLLFACIWTFILNWLCKKGYSNLSWFLVVLPYIIILLAVFKIAHLSEDQKSYIKALKLQSAYGQEPMTMPPKKK